MKTEQLTLRRKNAIEQLEKQLTLGSKPNRGNDRPEGMTITAFKKAVPRIPLRPQDIKRIKKNITILKTKIQQP